jgi:FkbM family methyltransferase
VIERLLKPHYLFRPTQAARRLGQALSRSSPESAMVTLPWGLPLRVDTTEDIGRAIWQLGLYDLAVSEALWRLLEPGALALDVGANIGCMTSLMAWRGGLSGRVLAFEPHPEIFRRLTENVERFAHHPSVAAVELHDAALAGRIGHAYLECGDPFARNRGTARLTERESALRIATTTLDEALGGRTACVVKIDVEGAELEVLHGARGALREGRIRSLIYEAHPSESRGLAELLRGHGYRIFALGRNLRGPILSSPDLPPRLPPYEAPSFLATLDPGAILRRMGPRGWRVL